MRMCLFFKFKQNLDLAKLLKETGNSYIEERNCWGNRFWGTVDGLGKNWLGKLLMEVRETL
jgi:predicted NAD-dependent protein-ADP-ribosyltransferase YbiA (DUF1768 family)